VEPAEGARSFATSGEAYDAFMGRYSRPLATVFADAAGIVAGQTVLDVGCGPGALTEVLVERLGRDDVRACDPSPPFVEACRSRLPGVDVRAGRAEAIPFDDGAFDAALAQLVLHFVSEPGAAADELRRVLRPGGVAAACVWDFAGGMQMLRAFWDAAVSVVPDAPDEAHTLRFGRQGEIAELLATAGFGDIEETTLDVASTYTGFDELWSGFLAGIGPAGAFLVSLADEPRQAIREQLYRIVGSPTGPFTLGAVARCARGTAPR
jgi:SAM-dependent methyltransferase